MPEARGIPSVFLAQSVQKAVFLYRLPASLVQSTGVPELTGSATATPESERAEQPSRNPGAERDGLLPNRVLLPGANDPGLSRTAPEVLPTAPHAV